MTKMEWYSYRAYRASQDHLRKQHEECENTIT